MCLFRNKFNKIKKEDINDAIYELEKQCSGYEDDIQDINHEIELTFAKGKAEKSKELKIFYAKNISRLKGKLTVITKRMQYVLYNITLMEKLKATIEDNEFYTSISKKAFGDALRDQKGLRTFLNKSLKIKQKHEDELVAAEDIFNEVDDSYMESDRIYGVKDSDDELLAMFETESSLDDEIASGSKVEDREDNISIKREANKEM